MGEIYRGAHHGGERGGGYLPYISLYLPISPTTEASVVAEPSLASAAVRPALSLSWVTCRGDVGEIWGDMGEIEGGAPRAVAQLGDLVG